MPKPLLNAEGYKALTALVRKNPTIQRREIHDSMSKDNWYGNEALTLDQVSNAANTVRTKLGVSGRYKKAGQNKPSPRKFSKAKVARIMTKVHRLKQMDDDLPPLPLTVKFCPCCGTNIEAVAMALKIARQSGR